MDQNENTAPEMELPNFEQAKQPFDYDLKCPWQGFKDCLKFQCPFYQWIPGAYVVKKDEEPKPENYIPVYGCKRVGFKDEEMANNGQ